ncbi:MAG TPA: TonB-dependent receptor, partial [Tichowtungia sp.]|nr:TonB-dependent receptor [Tichowtungia sp.]
QKKEFGARGYYGVPDNRAADEQTEENMILFSAIRGRLTGDYLRGGFAWREFYDDYAIPFWNYENHHRSRMTEAFIDGRTLEINGAALGWRADAGEERTASTGVGWNHRTRGGISLLPQWRGDRLQITAGLRGEFFTGESPELLPQLGAEFLLSDNLTAFASYSESVRLPSYTELFYLSPVNAGDPTLQPQTAGQTEIGFKGIPSEFMDWKVSVFHRRSKNTIDWQKQTAGALLWDATDIGTLDTFGSEARLGWYPARNLEVQTAYTWLYKDKDAGDSGNYASLYALDYPEQLIQLSALWKPVEPLELGTVQTLRFQADNRIRRNGDFGADSSFVARFTPREFKAATLALL